MGTGIAGDFAGLQKLAEKLAALPKQRLEMADRIGEEAIDLIKEGFDDSTDPYGRGWDKKSDGSDCNLVGRTSNLFSSWHTVHVSADEVSVGNATPYAFVHQGGMTIKAKNIRAIRGFRGRTYQAAKLQFKVGGQWVLVDEVTIPQRRMVPDDGDLPAAWRGPLEETVEEMLRELLS